MPLTGAAEVAAVAILVALGLIVGGVVALTSGGSKHKTSHAGEIFLQPVADPGRNPFGSSVATPLTKAQLGRVTKPGAAASTGSGASGPLTITTVSGATPALYGGSNQLSVCDKSAMVAFLEANPGKAAAWAGVQGISVSALPAYIAKLSTDGGTIYTVTLGGSGSSSSGATALDIDSAGAVYAAGTTTATDFPVRHDAT